MHLFRLTSPPSMSQGLCVLLLAPWSLPSLQGLCAQQRFVRLSTQHPGPALCGASMGFSPFAKPVVQAGPQPMSCLCAEVQLSLFRPSKSLLCQVF